MAEAPPELRSWLDRRTRHFSAYQPAALTAAKGETTVSVVLPALDEAATIGAIVTTVRTELMEQVGLVDELVVVDTGSSDATVAEAEAAGARVVSAADVLPAQGHLAGKGEALWKSLYATSGDLVCWVDADVVNFHAGFVYGLLGPLLTQPEVSLVKAFYDRPLDGADQTARTAGGRVTELVARPLINLHWPALAGLRQPLSGECAGRRDLLEQLPFPCGYGVELGLLVDTLELAGLDAIAQVDLDRRVHRNRDIGALGRMSFEILHTALSRLEQQGRLVLADAPGQTLVQFLDGGGTAVPVEHDLTAVERPPMRSLAEYADRWARD